MGIFLNEGGVRGHRESWLTSLSRMGYQKIYNIVEHEYFAGSNFCEFCGMTSIRKN